LPQSNDSAQHLGVDRFSLGSGCLNSSIHGLDMSQDREIVMDFTLLGGPLHRLGCRLGLVDSENTVKLGLALGLLAWTILLVLSLIEGVSGQVLSFSVIGGHIRLLLVIPLFFICESLVDPRMTVFIQTIVRSRVVPHSALPALDYEIARISRWKDAWLPELIFMMASVLLTLMAPQLQLPGTSSSQDVGVTMTSLWYWIFCLVLFRFLILRWLWSLGLWYFLLWRISRQDLHLVPTHPDGVGGLGYLAVVQSHFTPFVLAISLLTAAMFAEEFFAGLTSFESIYPMLSLVLVLDSVIFIGPLFIFSSKLWACRVKGLSDYMELAADYVNDFDKKWLRKDNPVQESLLGTADLQSLADLNNSINVVRDMSWVPLNMRLLVDITIAALLPMTPLLLLKYPVSELTKKLFTSLVGL
jgi:hypothetical protein